MLLLKDDPLWTDLKSTILKVDELLAKAHQESITGFIEFDFSEFSAAILLDEGEILQCITVKNGKLSPVKEKDIFTLLKGTEARVGFYRLKKDIIHIIHQMVTSDVLFENMDSQYMDIKQLLLTLEGENFTGVIVLHSPEGECYLSLVNGSPGYCICKKSDRIIDSAQCVEQLLDTSATMLVSAYKVKSDISLLKDVVQKVMGENVERIEKMLDESGTSREELLKTVDEIEKITYLFFDKKKAKVLSQKLKKTIEEVMS